MNKTVAEARQLVYELLTSLSAVDGVERVLCPPFTALATLVDLLADTGIGLGAQDLHWEPAGAYTGAISPAMVAEHCRYVILGHSERRAYFGETDSTVNRKLQAALRQGLVPIVCVGETLEENEAGRTEEVVSGQLRAGLAGLDSSAGRSLVIAYEPVWAIGTGKAATADGANRVIRDVVRAGLKAVFGAAADEMRILYGGSVKPENAGEYFGQSDIDGALVGGASLKAADFIAIARAAAPAS